MIVHLPVALALLAPLVSGGLFLLIRRHPELRKLWLLSVFWHAALVLVTYAAMATGDLDREAAVAQAGEEPVAEHELAATVFLVFALVSVLPAALGLGRGAAGARLVSFACTLVLFALCVRTARLGGELVYRHGGAAPHVREAQGEKK